MAILPGASGGTKDKETDGGGSDLGSDGADPFLVNQTNAAVSLEQQGEVDIQKSDAGDALSFDVDPSTDPSDSGTTGGGGSKDSQDRQTQNTQDPTQNNQQVKQDQRPGPAVILQTGQNGGQPNQQSSPHPAPTTAPPRRSGAAWGGGGGGDSGGSSGLIIAGIVGLLALAGGVALGGS